MLKKILKWAGIAVAVLLLLIVIAAGIVYIAYPSMEVEASREVEVSPDAAFDAFLEFDHWHDYWDIYEVYPPEEEIGVGTQFAYDAEEGYVNLEITEFVPGEVIRFDMSGDELEADFALYFEPIENGTRMTASNTFEFDGVMRIMVAAYVLSGEVDSYYGNMMENVGQVALTIEE